MALYAKQLEFLLDGVVDDNGDVLDGGLVYVWLAGTSTLATLYQDRDKAVPQTNPVVLDSEGRGIAFADGTFKIEVRTSAGVNVWGPRDGLEYRVAAGDNNYQILASDYGTTQTQATIQAAITAINLMSPNTRELVLDTGDWEISSNISIPANIVLRAPKGTRLDIDSGATVTFAGAAPDAGVYQLFTGDGAVSFSKKVVVNFEWWYSGAGDATTTLQAALTALSVGGQLLISTDVTVADEITCATSDVDLRGVGLPTITFSDTDSCIFLTGTNATYGGILTATGSNIFASSSDTTQNSFATLGSSTSGLHAIGDVVFNTTPAAGEAGFYLVSAAGGLYSATRQDSTAYSDGAWVAWDSGTTVWECMTAGTTASSAPSIAGLSYGDTVTDGSVVWAYRAATKGATVESAKLGDKVYINDGSTTEYMEWNSGTSKIALSHGIETASIDLGTNTISDGTLTGNWGFSSGNLSGIGTIGSGAITSTGAVEGTSITDGTATLSSGSLSSVVNIGLSGTISGGSSVSATTITDGTASLSSGSLSSVVNIGLSGTISGGSSVSATTITDGTASLTGGNWTGIGSLTATTLTDGTASLTGGTWTGITSLTATTITDGVASLNAGAWTGITTINTTGNIYTKDVLAYNASAGEVRQTRTGTVASDSTIGTWTGYANSYNFTSILSHVVDATGSSEDGALRFYASTAGTPTEYYRMQESVNDFFKPVHLNSNNLNEIGTLNFATNNISDGNFNGDWEFNQGTLDGVKKLTLDNNTTDADVELVFEGLDGATPRTATLKLDVSLNRMDLNSDLYVTDSVTTADLVASELWLSDGITAPSATGGAAKLYVDTSDGDLKVIFGDGVVKTIVTDS